MEHEENVVYYDLHVQEKRRRLLFPKASNSSSSSAAVDVSDADGQDQTREKPTHCSLLTTPRALFPPHELPTNDQEMKEEDEEEDEEEEDGEDDNVSANPFASLFKMTQKPLKAAATSQPHVAADEILEASASEDSDKDKTPPIRRQRKPIAAPAPAPTPTASAVRNTEQLPVRSRRTPLRGGHKPHQNAPVGHFETLHERPARWSTRSSSSLLERRSKPLTSANDSALAARSGFQRGRTQRMSSLSAFSRSNSATSSAPRLSDVLQRATELSQAQTQHDTGAHHASSPSSHVQANRDEAIEDTDQDAQNDRMEPQFFSPPPSCGKLRGRRRSSVENPSLARLRGPIGDMVRSAARKAARDLTLFRSVGQRLLEASNCTDENPVRSRSFLTMCLTARTTNWQLPDDQVVFAGWIHEHKASQLDEVVPTESHLHVVFRTSQYLSLRTQMLVRIYAPYHFVNLDEAYPTTTQCQQSVDNNQHASACGKLFLLGTSLTEVLESNCTCSHVSPRD